MAKSGGFGAGAKKMGGPGMKPRPPASGGIGGMPGGSSPSGPSGPMGAFKKGGPVKKDSAKADRKRDKKGEK